MEEKKSLSGLRPCSVAASEGGDDKMKVVDVGCCWKQQELGFHLILRIKHQIRMLKQGLWLHVVNELPVNNAFINNVAVLNPGMPNA